jgi:hypothetical protein
VFQGGFLGLDNIGVFDRSAALAGGGHLEQADGTGWMALFSQNMLELALALMEDEPEYGEFVLKFVEHFYWIAAAVDPVGEHLDEMWTRSTASTTTSCATPTARGSASGCARSSGWCRCAPPR